MGVEDGPGGAEADLAVRDPTAGEAGKAEQAEPSGEKKQLWTQLSGYVGRDVLSLMSLPIWLMEEIAPANTVVAVERTTSGGEDSSTPSSRKIE